MLSPGIVTAAAAMAVASPRSPVVEHNRIEQGCMYFRFMSDVTNVCSVLSDGSGIRLGHMLRALPPRACSLLPRSAAYPPSASSRTPTVHRHLHSAKSLPQLNLQAATAPQPAAAVAPAPPQEARGSDKDASSGEPISSTTAKASNGVASQAAGVLQLGQFSSPQELHTAWQQQLAPACRAAWGALRSDTQAILQQLNAESQEQQQQQQLTWSASSFLLELDALLGELQEV
jgi:hypothetical protein